MNLKVLKCQNCLNEFVWSMEEQELYEERGIEEPSHCPVCRGMFEAERKNMEDLNER